MTFFRTAGLVRSARSWGALGATLALLVGLSTLAGGGFTGGAKSLALQTGPAPEAYFKQSPAPPDVPLEVLIGEQFTFQVRFRHHITSTAIGYGPFIDLAINFRGVDNNLGGLDCDGIEFLNAQMVDVNPGALALTSTKYGNTSLNNCSASTAPHPYLGVGVVTFPTGWQLVTIELPFGSFDQSQPEIVVAVTAQMHPFADVNQPLGICERGGFRFGATATVGSPILEPGTTNNNVSTWNCEKVTPTVFTLKKEYLGPENEAVAGPNFINYYPLKYKITVDIADGQTINNLVITDNLSGNLQFVGIVLPESTILGVMVSPVANCKPQNTTGPPVIIATPIGQGGTLTVTLCNPITGTTDPDEVVITFEFYIPDKVLAADCNNAPVKVPNDVIATGDWDPLDPRDPTLTSPPGTTVPVTSDITKDDHILYAKCLAIQKSVEFFQDTGATGATPGDILKYTLKFQISDYHTIGDIVVMDFLADGQDFLNTPTADLRVTDQFGTTSGPFPPSDVTTTPNANAAAIFCPPPLQQPPGGTILKFGVSTAMVPLPKNPPGIPRHTAGILTGGFATVLGPSFPPLTTAAEGEIVFYAQIRDDFAFPVAPGDQFVDKHDPMNNCVTIEGAVYQNEPANTVPTQVIGSAHDTSATQVTIVTDVLKKSVYAVKRGNMFVCASGTLSTAYCSPGVTPDVHPGDEVTFRIEYTIPSGDAENLVIQDWLPLPVFAVGDPAATGSSSWTSGVLLCTSPPPLPGNACHLVAPPAPTTFTQSSATNSLKFDYGTFNNPANTPQTIDLLFTLTVTNKPFADRLFLTNEVQECEDNTFGVTFCQIAVAQVNVREPKLGIRKGIIATDNPHGQFSQPAPALTTPPTAQAPAGVTWINSPGGPNPRFTGVINSTNLMGWIDSDLTGVDANDHITFAIVIENQGGHPAFDVKLEDVIPVNPATGNPSCFKIDFNSINVTDGTATTFASPPTITQTATGGFTITFPSASPIPAFDPNNGKNIVVITFDATLIQDIKSGCCENVAKLENYASQPNGPNFVSAGFGGPFVDTAKVCVGPRALAKCIQETSELHTVPQSAPPGMVEAAIGEIVRFRLVIVIPEGTTLNFQITDLLPVGLTYVDNPKAIFVADTPVTNPLGIGTVNGNVSCAGPTPTDPITVSPSTFPFGTGTDPNFPAAAITITNNDPNDSNLEFLIIEFNAQVDNINAPLPGNQDGVVLTNTFEVKYKDVAGNAFSSTSGPIDVKIVEPNLTLTKTANPTTVTQGGTVTYTVTIKNTGTATAFDVRFTDTLPTGFTPGTISLLTFPTGCIGFTTGGLNVGVTCISPGFSGIPVNSVETITYQATVSPTVPCNTTLTNTAKVTWTSLPGDNGTLINPTGSQTGLPPGSIQGERDGSDGLLNSGVLNDYQVQASVTITVVCPKGCVQAPSASNMVAWWPLDEPASSPTVFDIAPSAGGPPPANNGQPQPGGIIVASSPGGPVSVPGNLVTSPPDGALFFSDPTDYVKVSPSSDLDLANSDLTIDAWIKPEEVHPVLHGIVEIVEPIVDKLDTSNNTGYAFYLYIKAVCLTPCPSPPSSGTQQSIEMHLGFAVGDGNSITRYESAIPIYTSTFTANIPSSLSSLSLPWPGWMYVAVTVNRTTGNLGTVYACFAPCTNVTTYGSFSPVPGMNSTTSLWIGGTRLYPNPIGIHGEITVNELEIFNVALPASDIQLIATATAGKCKPQTPTAATADLGDAPDSTNNHGIPMMTYTPPVMAHFPTVFNSSPPGPKHLQAKGLAWLGPDVSCENEADQPPDCDSVTNIDPPTNAADRDKFDDGVFLPIVIPACAQIAINYTVTSSTSNPISTSNPMYLNVWFDFNRDGDWEDIQKCPLGPAITGLASDWSVQDEVVTAPGTFTTPLFTAMNPNPGQPMWMRVTLSEQQAPAPPLGNPEGRGPVGGYKYGETEDYLVESKAVSELCGIKFNDLNGNGVQNTGEPGLPNWVITVTGPNGIVAAVTNLNGNYCIPVPVGGTYTVAEQQQVGWTQTAPPAPGTYTVTVPPAHTNLNFGNKQTTGQAEICVFKFEDLDGDGVYQPNPPNNEPLLPGWQFNVTPGIGTVTTGSTGGICFGVPAPGTYTISEVPQSGWTPTTPTSQTVTVAPNQLVNLFFGNKKKEEPKCDLEIKKEVTPNPVASGGTVTIKLTVTNVGTADCQPGPFPGTIVRDNQPVGLTFPVQPVSVNQPGWSCGFEVPTPNLTCATMNTLPVNYQVTFTFTATVIALVGSSSQNCATVTNTNDTNPANNQSCVTIQVSNPPPPCCIDLRLDKTLDGTLNPERQATYLLRIMNVGGASTTSAITVLDALPEGLAFVSASGQDWTCFAFGPLVTCTTAAKLAPNQSSTIQLIVLVRARSGTEIKNCGVANTEGDAKPDNNQGCHTATVK